MALKTKVSPVAPVHILTIMEDCQVRLDELKNKAWGHKKAEIALRGFRKGTVPQTLAEEKVGYDNLYEDVIKDIVTQACIETEERIVGLGQVYVDSFESGKPAIFRAEVWLEPKVHLQDIGGCKLYEGLTIEAPDIEVEDAEVEALIQRMREGAAVTESVSRPSEEGDVLTIDFEGKIQSTGKPFNGGTAKDFKVIVGSGTMLHEFETQLKQLATGDETDIRVTFPDNYHAQDLAGQIAVFKTTVKDVSKRTLPEVDCDFAKEMSYSDLTTMRSDLHADLTKNKEQQSKMLIENQLLVQLIQKVMIDPVPECMVNDQIESNVGIMLQNIGMTLEAYLKKAKIAKEQLIEQYRNSSATDVRAKLILKNIAANEGLEATDEEKTSLLEVLLPDYAEKDQETLEKEVNFDTLTLNVRVKKAVEYIREKAVFTKPEDLSKLEKAVEETLTEDSKEVVQTNG